LSKIEVDKVDPQSGTTLTLGTSGDTVSIPSGVTLANAGTATGFAAIDWQSTIVTGSTHTASANQGIWINTTSNACNLTLPGSPSVGDQLIFSDFLRTWGANAVTLTLNGSKFQGNTTPVPVYDTQGETVHIVYSGSTQGWIPINDGAVAFETPQSYTVDFLVIAGGGGGGGAYGNNNGGGGAGGYRNSYASETSGANSSSESSASFSAGTVYTVTVGAGGTSNVAPGAQNGGDSSITGSGFTTITSVGGGRGGEAETANADGANGGSGGGAGFNSTTGGTGTANQGLNGAAGVASGPGYAAGGGGGASAAGTVGTNPSTKPAGGNGLASSITASSVTRGGGGGGGHQQDGTASPGGSGGGGDGGSTSTRTGTDGTANTGGGGGGSRGSDNGGNGGSGVVILRIPTADYSGTTTGSPTVTTSGTDKIIVFNASGSITG
jgi:hypothetical protein